MRSHNSTLPERIQKRLQVLQEEIDQLISHSSEVLKTQLPNPIQFQFANSAGQDVLTQYERAQSTSFITRYELLPDNYTVKIVEHEGQYFIGNMDSLRHALNEFRPLIQNEQDSVYYQKVHAVWYRMLTLDDPNKGTVITVFDKAKNNVTGTFTQWLSERNMAISHVLQPLEYKYLYNGIIQHSDPDYSERFVEDYTSGELNYILWKHAHCLGFIRSMLGAYYSMLKFLTSPRLGSL